MWSWGRHLSLLSLLIIGIFSAEGYRTLENAAFASCEENSAADVARTLHKKRSEAKVMMNKQEMFLLESYLSPNDLMLEWGSGHSTLWYSQFVSKYFSIEHHEPWYQQVQSQIEGTGKVNHKLSHVPDGHKGWGGGFEEGTYEQFEEYVKAVDSFKVDKFDKVLIDGRARIYCAEFILKNLHKDSIVFIHDFQIRKNYHGPVFQYYNQVAGTFEGQTLVVLRPKKEALEMAAGWSQNEKWQSSFSSY